MKANRYYLLCSYLQSLRCPGSSDVILHCGEEKFCAHRIVLESCGPYFEMALKAAADNAKDDKVSVLVVKDMEADTLNTILNFLYNGELKMVETARHMIKVMMAAYKLKLEELAEHCCNSLLIMLSHENAFEILDVYNQCGQHDRSRKVLQFIVASMKSLRETYQFLSLTVEQMKYIVQCAKTECWCSDELFCGILKWLHHDPETREEFIDDLFACVDYSLITRYGLQKTLRDPEVHMSSTLSQKVITFSLPVLQSKKCNAKLQYATYNPKTLWDGKVIALFCKYQFVERFDPKTFGIVEEAERSDCVHIFNAETRTWIHAQDTTFDLSKVVAMSSRQCGNTVTIVSAVENNIVCSQYNLKERAIKYSHRYHEFPDIGLVHSETCVFKGKVFLIGGIDSDLNLVSTVLYLDPEGFGSWRMGNPLKHAQSDHVLLVTSKHIYVIGTVHDDNCSGHNSTSIAVQYNSNPEKGRRWNTILIPQSEYMNRLADSFFVFQDSLHAMYVAGKETILLSFDHTEKKMLEKRFSDVPIDVDEICRVCSFASTSSQVYVSTELFEPIPNYSWQPNCGKWTELCKVRVKREVCNYTCNTSTNCVYATL